VIGARSALIAFNVYLASSDVDIAKKVAKAIRHSSGGLRFVKALGLLVDGMAQVSINLTNFRASPVGRVVELVRREAARHGVAIHHSELVGLIPQAALVDAAVWYTQLDGFRPEQILESKLHPGGDVSGAEKTAGTSRASFLEDVAAARPAPGGGSVAAYAGALGAALAEMVAGLTIGKPKYATVEPEMLALRDKAHKLRTELTRAVEYDATAFEAVMEAFGLRKETEAQKRTRTAAINAALLRAAQVPLETAERSVQVMEIAAQCARDGNLNAISDAFSGAAMARAALTAAGHNVRVNLRALEHSPAREEMLGDLAQLEARAEAIEHDVSKTMQERAKLA
jgi:glutamate formiminotransferase/formiminotetrahydrofolate cyclodeaminase